MIGRCVVGVNGKGGSANVKTATQSTASIPTAREKAAEAAAMSGKK